MGALGRRVRGVPGAPGAHAAALDWQAVVERFAEVLTGTGVVTGAELEGAGECRVTLRYGR